MKRWAFVTACLLLSPALAQAQFEIGMDGGLDISNGDGETTTSLSAPLSMVRIGFPGESFDFETLFSLNFISNDGSITLIQVGPGINYPIGEGNAYVRGEALVAFVSGGGDSNTELAIGAAIGTKRQLADSGVSLRFEAGYDRWLDLDLNAFRAIAGLSVLVGG